MTPAVLLTLTLFLPPCLLQPVNVVPWMTGQRLIKMYCSKQAWESAAAGKTGELQADSYIDGVDDR